MTWGAAQARAERQALEDSLAEDASRALALFLNEVYLIASAPGIIVAASLPDAFSQVTVRMAWNRVVLPLNSVLNVDAADAVYEKARSVLRARFASRAALRRALEQATAFEDPSNGWQALVARQARTAATAQFGALQAARFAAAGVTAKRWVADPDNATRPSHRAADGQVVPLHQAFLVGESLLQYPGDPAAPPSETENCRCVPVAARLFSQ